MVEIGWRFQRSFRGTFQSFQYNFNTEANPCFANTCEENYELLKRKLNKQYHTENPGLRSRAIFLLIDQFKTRQ